MMKLQNKLTVWALFIVLSFVWGSSFFLIKIGLEQLTAYQVASLRILSAGLILSPFALHAYKNIPRSKIKIVILSGLLSNFFPAFLFCIAETYIDSSLASIINALTPFFTIVIGVIFYQLQIKKKMLYGVIIGFVGLFLLPFASGRNISLDYILYSGFALTATILYGINVNIVAKHLKNLNALSVASLAFSFLIIPCIVILFVTGYFEAAYSSKMLSYSTLASCLLGIGGTALATILFYMLLKRAGSIMASMVAYGIPIVALFWGTTRGEKITTTEILCLLIILFGVYLVNKNSVKTS